MNKLILLVGVIGSGKDYYVQQYRKEHPNESVVEFKLGAAMVKLVSKIYNVDLSDKEEYEKWKSIPENREKLILIAEETKKALNNDIWAERTYLDILNHRKADSCNDYTYIISDIGFPYDFEVFNTKRFCFIDEFKVRFCDYRSSKYAMLDQPREKLAQFLASSFNNGKEWSFDDFKKIMDFYKLSNGSV